MLLLACGLHCHLFLVARPPFTLKAAGAALCLPLPAFMCLLCIGGIMGCSLHSWPCWSISEAPLQHSLPQVSWSPTGDAFLVVTSYSQVGGQYTLRCCELLSSCVLPTGSRSPNKIVWKLVRAGRDRFPARAWLLAC